MYFPIGIAIASRGLHALHHAIYTCHIPPRSALPYEPPHGFTWGFSTSMADWGGASAAWSVTGLTGHDADRLSGRTGFGRRPAIRAGGIVCTPIARGHGHYGRHLYPGPSGHPRSRRSRLGYPTCPGRRHGACPAV